MLRRLPAPGLLLLVGLASAAKKRSNAEEKSALDLLKEIGEPSLQCSGCEFVTRVLQTEVTQQLVEDAKACRGVPDCLKRVVRKPMRMRCTGIGDIVQTGSISMVGKKGRRLFANSQELMMKGQEHPLFELAKEGTEMQVETNKQLSSFCKSFVGDGKWLVQVIIDSWRAAASEGRSTLDLNVTKAGCGRELGLCRYHNHGSKTEL